MGASIHGELREECTTEELLISWLKSRDTLFFFFVRNPLIQNSITTKPYHAMLYVDTSLRYYCIGYEGTA